MEKSLEQKGRFFCHGRKHSETIFTIEIPIKILVASTCMIGFIFKNMAAGNLCNDRKSALILGKIKDFLVAMTFHL